MRAILFVATLILTSLPFSVWSQEPTWGKLTLSGWKKQLQDPSENVRHKAAVEFMFMDLAMVKQSIPELKEACKDQNGNVGLCATYSLIRCDEDATTDVPKLFALLEGKDVDAKDTGARERAVRSLGNLGEKAAVPVLIRQFGINPRLDDATALALCRLGTAAKPALPALKQLIRNDAQPEVLAHAGMAIASLEPEAPELQQVVTLLTPVERFLKGSSPPFLKAEFLVRFPELTIKHVVPLLEDKDKLVRRGAARILAAAGPKAKEQAAAPLQSALHDSDAGVRVEVVRAIYAIAPSDISLAIPVLVKLLGANGFHDFEAAPILRPHYDIAAPLLIRELETKNVYDQMGVIDTLCYLRQMDVYNKPPLDSETRAKRDAQLIAALSDPSLMIRRGAAAVMTRLGPQATTAVPTLLQLAKEVDAEARLDAITALVAVDPKHHSWLNWLPALEEIIRENNRSAQYRAITQIRTLGPAAKSAAPTLLRAVDENEKEVRRSAAVALVYVDPSQKIKVLPVLLEEIKKQDSLWFVDTAEALGEFGSAAKEALPTLHAALAAKKYFPYHQAKIIKALTRVDRGQIPLCRPAVEELLKSPKGGWEFRFEALMQLPEWGADAKPLAPILRELMKKQGINAKTEIATAISLVLVGGDEDGIGLSIIRKAINTPAESQKREHLLRIADQLGPLAKPLATELHFLTTDAELGEYAKVVLAKIDPKRD